MKYSINFIVCFLGRNCFSLLIVILADFIDCRVSEFFKTISPLLKAYNTSLDSSTKKVA